MAKRLFLLDGMALVYRAHFAFIARPVLTSQGVNTSALYGFTQTLLNILGGWEPTHLGVAFDTAAPTHRHREFAAYKATRQEMPEDLSAALPHVRRMLEAFNIPALALDGFEADDLIGTLVRRAEREGFQSYMVTSDKDFGQLVSAHNFIFKPARGGDGAEILGLAEIQARWGVSRAEQVVEVLALMGDAATTILGRDAGRGFVTGAGLAATRQQLIGDKGVDSAAVPSRRTPAHPAQSSLLVPELSSRPGPAGVPSPATPARAGPAAPVRRHRAVAAPPGPSRRGEQRAHHPPLRPRGARRHRRQAPRRPGGRRTVGRHRAQAPGDAVSYTHLTLPTIYSV